MTTAPPQGYSLGYCTNVHAGVDLAAIRENLENYAVAARDALGAESLGVGLWLPAAAAEELAEGGGAADFARYLQQRRLHAYTINGFPYDNFHQPVVKHRVYLPPWWDPRRLEHTCRLASILAELLPESEPTGSISTLPVGWPANPLVSGDHGSPTQLAQAGENFRRLADFLRQLESQCGRRIVVAIEPEPGCLIDTTDDAIAWFEQHLPEAHHRRYVTVCHDVCHAAVMMEDQSDVLTRLTANGIGIGKVQISSAIVADWQAMSGAHRREALQQLAEFAEDRYLHQTGRRTASGQFQLAGDLPELLEEVSATDDPVGGDRRWVVHFHVPVFLERFGHLKTSHDDVIRCLQTLDQLSASENASLDFTGHLEVETYAWSVLPEPMRQRGLAEDIAGEIRWLSEAIHTIRNPDTEKSKP